MQLLQGQIMVLRWSRFLGIRYTKESMICSTQGSRDAHRKRGVGVHMTLMPLLLFLCFCEGLEAAQYLVGGDDLHSPLEQRAAFHRLTDTASAIPACWDVFYPKSEE